MTIILPWSPWWQKPTIMIQEHKGFPKASKSECSNFLYPSSCHPSIPYFFPGQSNGCHSSFPLLKSSYWNQMTLSEFLGMSFFQWKTFTVPPNTPTATHPTLHTLHFIPLWVWSLHKVKFDSLPLCLVAATTANILKQTKIYWDLVFSYHLMFVPDLVFLRGLHLGQWYHHSLPAA